jgi:hypothetical protein
VSKYGAAKTLKLTRARVARTCEACGRGIEEGAKYYKESLGLMAKPPGLHLGSFCLACGKAKGDTDIKQFGDHQHASRGLREQVRTTR